MLRRAWTPVLLVVVAVSGIVMIGATAIYTAYLIDASALAGSGDLAAARRVSLVQGIATSVFTTSFAGAVVGWVALRWRGR